MHTFRKSRSAVGVAGSRMRLTFVAFAVALCATLGLAVAGPATASAAGPNVLSPGQSVTYPTWFWGATEFCATNNGSAAGMVRVRAVVNIDNQFEDVFVPGFRTTCIRRWWWANPIGVTNVSASALGSSAVLTVRAQ